MNRLFTIKKLGIIMLLFGLTLIGCTEKGGLAGSTVNFDKALNARVYFDSDSTYQLIRKDYIGGISGIIALSDSTLYFNYGQSDETLMKYVILGDSVKWDIVGEIVVTSMDRPSKLDLSEWEDLFNEHIDLNLPPNQFSIEGFKAIDQSIAKYIISSIWQQTLAKSENPESVELKSFDVSQHVPANEYERKWNDGTLFDDYRITVKVTAQDDQREEELSTIYGYLPIEDDETLNEEYVDSRLVVGSLEQVKQYDQWRAYSLCEGYDESDIAGLNRLLKNRFSIDVDLDVEELIVTPDDMGYGYELLSVTLKKERWRPTSLGGYESTLHDFQIRKTSRKIRIIYN